MNMLRQSIAGLLVLLAMTVVFGLGYPLVMTGVGQVAFHDQANGSAVQHRGQDIGSSLLGQDFKGAQWFRPRPSASSYDSLASGGTNLGPNSADLVKAMRGAKATIAAQDGVSPSQVPPDAVTASGSGLDPDISPAYAELQVARVAKARGISVAAVRKLVREHTQSRILGFLGEARVNVLELNVALAQASSSTTAG
jgi:potassium-transporting ATPase KdpC subunit